MAKIVRSAILLTIYLIALTILPGAYTAADSADASDEAATKTEAEASPSPAPEHTPSEAPELDPTPTPTTPEPSPSPTDPGAAPSPLPEAERPEPPEEARVADDLSFSLGAAPSTVAPGEPATITAVVANNSSELAAGVDVTVLLPSGLEYLSSSPAPDSIAGRSNGTALTFTSLDVPPGGSVTSTVQVTPGDATKRSFPIQGESAWAGGGATAQTVLGVEVPETSLELTTFGGGFLKEVGGQVSYEIAVKNTGDGPAEDVTVVNLVPVEVHVTGAGIAPGVDAVQVGNSGGREDVVWVINELPAHKTITVTYTGVVKHPGDLEAVNKTTASSPNAGKDTSEERTYLASAGGTGSTNPSFDPIREKKVTRRKVITRPLIRERVPTEPNDRGSAGNNDLPFTGVDPLGTVIFGMALVALGLIIVHATSANTDRRRIAAGSVTLLLVAGACMSNGGNEVEPRVKGIQITRSPDAGPAEGDDPVEGTDEPGDDEPNEDPDEDLNNDGPNDDAPGDDTDAPNGGGDGPSDGDEPGDGTVADDDGDDTPETDTVLVPGDPIVTFERDVDFVTITADDLPLQQLGTTKGSAMSFGWNDAAGSVTSATSSNATIDGVADLSAQISTSGPGMKLTVSITNIAEETVLGLEGTLAVELDAGGSRTLRAGSVDLELNPGGTTSSSFTFRLPTGSYSAEAVFLAS